MISKGGDFQEVSGFSTGKEYVNMGAREEVSLSLT